MYKILKSYVKCKFSLKLKDKFVEYSYEKQKCLDKLNEWEMKTYDKKFGNKEDFKKEQKKQIEFTNELWKMNHYKGEAVLEVIKMMEKL